MQSRPKSQGQGLRFRGQGHRSRGQGHKIWPRGALRPRPGLEDYITGYTNTQVVHLHQILPGCSAAVPQGQHCQLLLLWHAAISEAARLSTRLSDPIHVEPSHWSHHVSEHTCAHTNPYVPNRLGLHLCNGKANDLQTWHIIVTVQINNCRGRGMLKVNVRCNCCSYSVYHTSAYALAHGSPCVHWNLRPLKHISTTGHTFCLIHILESRNYVGKPIIICSFQNHLSQPVWKLITTAYRLWHIHIARPSTQYFCGGRFAGSNPLSSASSCSSHVVSQRWDIACCRLCLSQTYNYCIFFFNLIISNGSGEQTIACSNLWAYNQFTVKAPLSWWGDHVATPPECGPSSVRTFKIWTVKFWQLVNRPEFF